MKPLFVIALLLLLVISAFGQPATVVFFSSTVLTDQCLDGGPDPNADPLPDGTMVFLVFDVGCNGPDPADLPAPLFCSLMNGSLPPDGCVWVGTNPPSPCGYLGIYCPAAEILNYYSDMFVFGAGPQEIILSHWTCQSCAPPTLPAPTGLTCYLNGTEIILRWQDDDNLHYQVYSDSLPDGLFETLEGSTDSTFFVPANAEDNLRFYVVKGWDGR
jgi:hypothetical protein